jgi:hypothetical protein
MTLNYGGKQCQNNIMNLKKNKCFIGPNELSNELDCRWNLFDFHVF